MRQTAQPFNSVYVSFYKGLGALSGAMLLGDADFCAEARVWLRRLGGNLYSVLPYAVSSWDGFRRTCLATHGPARDDLAYSPARFERRRRKMARVVARLRADARIASLVRFDPVVPETNMVHGYLRLSRDACLSAAEGAARATATPAAPGGIRVLNRVRPLGTADDEGREGRRGGARCGCRFEWIMGEANSAIDDDVFLRGWKAFARAATEEGQVRSSAGTPSNHDDM